MRTSAPSSSAQLRRRGSLAAAAIALAGLVLVSPAHAQDQTFPSASPAPQVTSGPRSPDNDLAPRWSFSASDVATGFECSLTRDDTLVGDWAPCTSPAAYDLTSQADGVYRFAVRALGTDGAPSETATSDYVLDTSVPAQPTIVGLPGPTAANHSPEWRFTGGVDERFECRLDRGSDPVADWAPCSSPHQFDLAGQADGSFLFSVRGVAGAGRRGPVRTDGYLLDTSAPAAPKIASAPPELGSERSPTLAFSAEAGAQVECRAAGDYADDTEGAPCTSPYHFDLSGRADGTYTLALRA